MLLDNDDLEQRLSQLTGESTGGAVGMWQCDLPHETLTWTDGVYDIFELPRGFRVTRHEALGFYTPQSREMLEDVRSRAIRDGKDFTLDTEITTALGNARRMRIIAHVKYENGKPVRIFGIKLDITSEKSSIHRPG
jgi:PAS domain-containing protein